MKKILIEITSPAAGLTYDMFVPDTMQIGELSMLAGEVFRKQSNGMYNRSNTLLLCTADDGQVLEPSETIKSKRILHGTRLILF